MYNVDNKIPALEMETNNRRTESGVVRCFVIT